MFQEQDKLHIQKLKIILNSNTFLILLIIISSLYVFYKVNNIKSKYDINTNEIIGIITGIEKDDKKTKIILKSKENILVYYYDNIKLNLGDKIKVKGSLEPFNNNTIFNLFNYKKYMLSKNTYYKMNTKEIEVSE